VILTPEELVTLTRRVKSGWQRRELQHLGIPFRARSDGSLIVFWEDVRPPHNQQPKPREPQLRLPQ
jgi:Domain of unknown function (DUF4224)